MTTARILDFIRTRRPDGPCLVVDLDVVRDNFQSFRKALPDSAIFYAVKANPAPEILRLLANLGSNFDCASVAEIEMAIKAGATAVVLPAPGGAISTEPGPRRNASSRSGSTVWTGNWVTPPLLGVWRGKRKHLPAEHYRQSSHENADF